MQTIGYRTSIYIINQYDFPRKTRKHGVEVLKGSFEDKPKGKIT